MNLKRILLILIVLCFGCALYAQKGEVYYNYEKVDNKRIHFGFSVGINTMDFKLTPSLNTFGADSAVLYPEINKLSPGFHVNVVSSLKITDNLDLRFLPGISLGERSILFYDEQQEVVSKMDIESTFIDLPLLFKYKAIRVNNMRPYLVGGINVRRDMARNKEFNDENEVYIKLKPFDVFYEIGFGLDFYLTYFKFSTEVKYSVGLLNTASPDPSKDFPQYANAIDQLNTRMFMVSFHFE